MTLYKLNNVCIKGNKLNTSTKFKLNKSLVKSILLYNCGTWALTLTEEERLNAYHRKQLKKILNIRYPKKITNKSLYRICQEKPLSLQIHRLAGVSLFTFYEETKTFLQIKQQELILSLMVTNFEDDQRQPCQ